ncbi:thiol:disulfide interchange protein DsbA/DsbL [Glaesserella parasuis]|uniref:thiol:disulfide interchange protein DsbA/DsbL n=1 Tax=Glaesserella parasuis TaxID=738 RepID=UPI00135DD5A2|nr:thiol:disulfide interchange protein DsbA/DsbL [Glaesserella parasuis]MDG6286246.1 thiol:disulfide interchange protein DsbA/DsbL [Glaesserella parasuis]MDG6288129.1 thiol:disulfide interchange protein DsbA/DsbL [Glaesserella parasuis]MDG6290348.1 thiol:disulfide interchange protein DsbA/DsbL [Glaesserella parasuis]MDG6292347.1 thiol:disulfide interchange protein DsbA/DsbL [Glaesserella parasuis]MDO9648426.1 thiol:disulfide interchange protein DsbA/DsbL [Glaesserella parasuis]
MKFRNWIYFISLWLFISSLFAEEPTKTPLFQDGKGYYSYKKPLDILLPKDNRVLITYFYQYGCEVCLNGDDYLKQYASRHSDKVVLERVAAFSENKYGITVSLNALFSELGKPELSEKYLFDSSYQNDRLITNGKAITKWLNKHQISLDTVEQVRKQENYPKRISQNYELIKRYSPPVIPMAVLNGKYILTKSTLYNDDYTYAVLDFLVDKLQKEQQGVTK